MGRRLSSTCKEIEQERADRTAALIRRLEGRVAETLHGTTQPRKTRGLFQPITDRLLRLKEGLQARAPLVDCLVQCEETSKEIDEIETRVKTMDTRHALYMIWALFSRDIILVFFITGAVGLVLFPGAISLLSALRPDLSLIGASEVWGAQKAILLSGSLFALFFAAFHAFMARHNPGREEG